MEAPDERAMDDGYGAAFFVRSQVRASASRLERKRERPLATRWSQDYRRSQLN